MDLVIFSQNWTSEANLENTCKLFICNVEKISFSDGLKKLYSELKVKCNMNAFLFVYQCSIIQMEFGSEQQTADTSIFKVRKSCYGQVKKIIGSAFPTYPNMPNFYPPTLHLSFQFLKFLYRLSILKLSTST